MCDLIRIFLHICWRKRQIDGALCIGEGMRKEAILLTFFSNLINLILIVDHHRILHYNVCLTEQMNKFHFVFYPPLCDAQEKWIKITCMTWRWINNTTNVKQQDRRMSTVIDYLPEMTVIVLLTSIQSTLSYKQIIQWTSHRININIY